MYYVYMFYLICGIVFPGSDLRVTLHSLNQTQPIKYAYEELSNDTSEEF